MNKYLLKNTPETPQMLEGINDLLESDNDTNIILAFQLIKTGGCPVSLLSSILAFAIWHKNRKIRLRAQSIFRNTASQAFQKEVNIDFSEYYFRTNESVVDLIEILAKSTYINKNNFANTTFQITKLGLDYCIKHQTKTVKDLLQKIVENDILDLDGRSLVEIPKEIGELRTLKHLHLRYNNIKKIPRELAKLTHLETFLIDEEKLYSSELTFLYQTFPKVFENQYVQDILDEIDSQDFQAGRKVATKLKKISPAHYVIDFLEASKLKNKKGTKNNKEALFYYEKCLNGDFSATTWKNIAQDLCDLRASDMALKATEKGLEVIKNKGISGHNDEANLYFYEGLAHFWAKDYQKSILSNEKSLTINNYAGTWFNKACCYSKMNIKDKMLYDLEECFKLSAWQYVPMASVDKDNDFENFKKDKDFIKLIDKYEFK